MHNATGAPLSGLDHLRQSIADILSTPLGSRVMRRDYGSRLFELTDTPMNRNGVMDVIIAAAEALKKWEPRLNLTAVRVAQPTSDGRLMVGVEGIYTHDGRAVALDGIVI
ncbi:MAG: GPW/gp25 family protein [Mariprofundaceae bacterium]|nr:GPW/gp25 family protein [Mariprofundaceae bacterium]